MNTRLLILRNLLILRCALPAAFAATLPALLAAAPASAPAAAAAASPYAIVDLGAYDPQNGGAAAVNNSGRVVGSNYDPATQTLTALLTGPGGAMPFKTFAAGTEAVGINDSAQICGALDTAATTAGLSRPHAFLSAPNGGALRDLGTLGGAYSVAYRVNAGGQVTGFAETAAMRSHAFLSGPNGGALRDLGTLGGSFSRGFGINDSGQVCGDSETPAPNTLPDGSAIHHAFLSGPNGAGPLRDLGTLGGHSSLAFSVNARGQVTGEADTPSGTQELGSHAFLSGPNGAGPLRDLGTLGGNYSFGAGINAAGQVAGVSSYPGSNSADTSDTHAFLYTNGVMTDLNRFVPSTSGIVLSAATLSDSGYILASGTLFGQAHGFLLTPVSTVNLGPNLVVTAVSSVLVNTFGTRFIAVTVTNNGVLYADKVQITGISVNGLTPPFGDIHNVLPTIPNLLRPGETETDTVVYQLPLAATRAALTVSGTYVDPRTNGTGHFSSAVRLALPPPAR